MNNNETLALSSGATLTATSLTAGYNDTFDLTGATLTATSLTMTSYDDTFDLTGGTLTVGSVSMYEDETFSLSSGATLSITGNVTDTYGNSYYSINDSKFTVEDYSPPRMITSTRTAAASSNWRDWRSQQAAPLFSRSKTPHRP